MKEKMRVAIWMTELQVSSDLLGDRMDIPLVQRHSRSLHVIPVINPRTIPPLNLQAEMTQLRPKVNLGVVPRDRLERSEIDIDVFDR